MRFEITFKRMTRANSLRFPHRLEKVEELDMDRRKRLQQQQPLQPSPELILPVMASPRSPRGLNSAPLELKELGTSIGNGTHNNDLGASEAPPLEVNTQVALFTFGLAWHSAAVMSDCSLFHAKFLLVLSQSGRPQSAAHGTARPAGRPHRRRGAVREGRE